MEKVFVTSGKKKCKCSKGDWCSFWHESNDRAKPTPKAAPPSDPQSPKARGRSVSRKRNARGRSQTEKFNRPPCKYFLKGTCTESLCEYWHPPECQFYKTKSGCKFSAECSFPHWKVEEQPNNKPKKGDDKSAVAIVKSVRQLSCVSQDTEPPGSATITRKGTKCWDQFDENDSQELHCAKANIWENKGPSLGKIQVKLPHQRSHHAMKFEDRSHEKTERQQRWARSKAWNLAKSFYQENLQALKGRQSYILLTLWGVDFDGLIHSNPEEREFVVDSGAASMLMNSKKDLNKTELETVRISKNPIMVVTANGEVQTKEDFQRFSSVNWIYSWQ